MNWDSVRSTSTREEDKRWHNREEKDVTPNSLQFTPATALGPRQQPGLLCFCLQLFFSNSTIKTIFENTNANLERRLQVGKKKFVRKVLTMSDFSQGLSLCMRGTVIRVESDLVISLSVVAE